MRGQKKLELVYKRVAEMWNGKGCKKGVKNPNLPKKVRRYRYRLVRYRYRLPSASFCTSGTGTGKSGTGTAVPIFLFFFLYIYIYCKLGTVVLM